jgi:RHS repeat-associated protein
MGARFYAADLGVWTIGDPILITGPEKTVSEQFATANPYAYSNLNPVIAVDNDGNFGTLSPAPSSAPSSAEASRPRVNISRRAKSKTGGA